MQQSGQYGGGGMGRGALVVAVVTVAAVGVAGFLLRADPVRFTEGPGLGTGTNVRVVELATAEEVQVRPPRYGAPISFSLSFTYEQGPPLRVLDAYVDLPCLHTRTEIEHFDSDSSRDPRMIQAGDTRWAKLRGRYVTRPAQGRQTDSRRSCSGGGAVSTDRGLTLLVRREGETRTHQIQQGIPVAIYQPG